MTTNSFFGLLQRRRTVLLVTLGLALVSLPFLFLVIKPTYTATSHVLMIGNGTTSSMMPSTDMGLLASSETVVERVAKRFSLGPDLSQVVGRIDAKVPHASNVMPVSFRDKDRKTALDVTNALADETVAYYKELSGGQYDQMIGYLGAAAKRDQNRIRTIDGALQKAAQQDSYVGSEAALDAITLNIRDLESQRATAYAALVSDEAIADAQSAQPAEIAGIVKQEVLAGNPYVQALRAGQAHDAAQLQFQRAQFTDRFPGLPGLQEQVSQETAALTLAEHSAVTGSPASSISYAATVLARRNALAVAAGDRAKVKAIDDQIAAEHGHLRDLAGTGSTVNLLRFERDAAKAAYGATIAKLTETRANQAAASSIGALVILDHAADAFPRIPRLAMDIIVAVILLALTLGVGYIVDVLDPTLRSPEAIEKLYGLPIVGNLGSKR